MLLNLSLILKSIFRFLWFNGIDFLRWLLAVEKVKKVRAGSDRMAVFGLIVYRVSSRLASPTELHLTAILLIGYNYLAFDIVGDLAFGSPFGMLTAAEDSARIAKHIEGSNQSSDIEKTECIKVPAIQILSDKGYFSATLGTLPPWIRPFVRKLPWFTKGGKAVKNMSKVAAVMVSERLAVDSDRIDLLSKLMEGKDGDGMPMGREELIAEAETFLVAGSDTTSK